MVRTHITRHTDDDAGARILIVEDEGVIAMDIESSLQELGYIVTSVADSADVALREAERHQPDLVLMDIQLRGDRDGLWAADQVRQRWGTPVIFITANTNTETLIRAKASGAYGFLNKPFRPKELDAAVSIALNQHNLTRALFAERSWFSTTMCSLSDGVIATDPEGRVRFLNPAAERMTGWTKAEALGRDIEEIYPLSSMDGKALEECQLRKAIHERSSIPKRRFLLATQDGRMLPVEDAASPIMERGQILGAVTTFVEISALLQTEQMVQEQQEALQAKVEMTSQALGQTREELQALSRHLLVAQEEERGRIARELHDDFGQRVALLSWKMSELPDMVPPEAQAKVQAMRDALQDLASEMRGISHRLHPSILSDLGLAEALQSLISEYRELGLTIRAHVAPATGLSQDVATSLYRIAQEALQNVLKHAPEASVCLKLLQGTDRLLMHLRDDGPGFSVQDVRGRGGLGLISMQERARLVGGSLELVSRAGQGTTVVVRVPVSTQPR
ncbi:response regulator [Terriglobus aquaticus]|uniref:Oxygen sensor histidine kinase NreB n=1 Tax=Terriglobus aquaticus TaxID=940139 RepID=A0ABW9KGD7_9BACT|nr:response regulator [Terriglobus aquaticus]